MNFSSVPYSIAEEIAPVIIDGLEGKSKKRRYKTWYQAKTSGGVDNSRPKKLTTSNGFSVNCSKAFVLIHGQKGLRVIDSEERMTPSGILQ